VTLLVARLARGIEYGAIDGEPVDLVVLLLSPEEAGADHLKALARVSRTLRSPAALAGMRQATDAEALFAAVSRPPADRSQAA
jgi:PTS system nitrogen regulatory IIA component